MEIALKTLCDFQSGLNDFEIWLYAARGLNSPELNAGHINSRKCCHSNRQTACILMACREDPTFHLPFYEAAAWRRQNLRGLARIVRVANSCVTWAQKTQYLVDVLRLCTVRPATIPEVGAESLATRLIAADWETRRSMDASWLRPFVAYILRQIQKLFSCSPAYVFNTTSEPAGIACGSCCSNSPSFPLASHCY